MSTPVGTSPVIGGTASQLNQLSGTDPLIYTVPPGSDQTIVVHIYISISPTAQNVNVGQPVLTYTDEWGVQNMTLYPAGSPLRLSVSVPLRVKAASTVSITNSPSGSGVYSSYQVVEVLSLT